MRLNRFSLACIVLGACFPTAMAQVATTPQESATAELSTPDFANLQLDYRVQLELEKAIQSRDYKRAETILIEQAERNPKSMQASKLLALAGGIFFLDGQYLNSAISWKKAEAIAPLDDRNRFTLAMAYIKLGRREWARPELEKLAAAAPQNALYQYWLARLDYDAQHYAAAIDRLKKVIELDPKMMRAYDALGLCYDYLGQFDDAIKSYSRAIELNQLLSKPSAWPHVNLAISLVVLNRLEEAEKNLRQAISYDAQLPQAQYQLGRVLEKQGRNEEAVKALTRAAELAPAYPDPHFALSRIYRSSGKNQLSKTEIEKFKQLKHAEELQAPLKPAATRN